MASVVGRVCGLMRRPQHGQGIGGCPGGEGEEKRQEQRRQPCSDPPCGDTPRRRGRDGSHVRSGSVHGPDCIHPAFLVARSWRAPLLRELSARVGVSISQGRSVRMPRRSHDLPGYRGNSPHGGFVGDTNRSFWSYPAADNPCPPKRRAYTRSFWLPQASGRRGGLRIRGRQSPCIGWP